MTTPPEPPAPIPLPPVEIAQKTDPGRDPAKQVNEDMCGHRETAFGHLLVVCDGMGGHAGGREASTLALETIFSVFAAAHVSSRPPDVLRSSIEEANRRVYAMEVAEEGGARPGSTVVALLIHSEGTEVAHVGDSRCYRIHGATVTQLTKDHSMVQKLVDANVITPEQAAVHPDANKILRALGIQAEVEVEVMREPVAHVAGDAFVLCSDGLSDLVSPEEILQIAGATPPPQAVGQLVALANARGGHDNITVQIVKTRESAVASSARVAATILETAPATLADDGSGRGAPSGARVPHATAPMAQAPADLVGAAAATSDRKTHAMAPLPAATPAQGLHVPQAIAPGATPSSASGAAPPGGASGQAPAASGAKGTLVLPRPGHARGPSGGQSSGPRNGRSGGPSLAVIAAIGLGVIGLAIVAVLLFMQLRDRGGKPHPNGALDLGGDDASEVGGARGTGETPLEPAPLPETEERESEPLPALTPPPSPPAAKPPPPKK
jgi:protein phosphatase